MTTEKTNNNNNSDKISPKELYPSLVQLIIHDETITWNRFSNFLLFNSILILAWVTIYSAESKSSLDSSLALVVLTAIGILGLISGFIWSSLGKRGRAFLKEHMDQASEIEKKFWGEDLQSAEVEKKPITEAIEIRDSHPSKYSGSYYILSFGPKIFIILHIVLLWVSCTKMVKIYELVDAISPFFRYGGS